MPKLALHTWTLLSTPLAEILGVAARTGWDAIEVSARAFAPTPPAVLPAMALPADEIARLVAGSRLPVACVGVDLGWMWAEDDARRRLLRVFDERCRFAVAVGCSVVMSPVDGGTGDVDRAVASVREVGDIAARHGVRLAVEFNSQAQQLNTLARARDLLRRAAHPACGLLVDTYHLGRSGAALSEVEELTSSEIAYVQFSDVPRSGLRAGFSLDRLPPGAGSFPFRAFFATLAARGYAGFASYEAPNEEAWKRPAEEVAREALRATRAVLDVASA